MKVTPLSISDLLLIEPSIFEDDRGFFFESFNEATFQKKIPLSASFVQDNHSKSHQGVLRGLHYQLPPHAQGKLVRVLQGEVLDVIVDIRRSSPTFGDHVSVVLSAENKKQIWIPEGFAHGFLTLSKTSEFFYKTTTLYNSDSERCILYNDKKLDINWGGIHSFNLSPKDRSGKSFIDAEVFP